MQVRGARRCAPWAIAATLVTGTAAALPAEPPLGYEAPSGCPGRETLVREIQARLPRATDRDVERSSAGVRVRIEREDDGFGAVLTMRADRPRRLVGDTCQEVVQGLAIVIAYRIEQDQRDARASVQPGLVSTGVMPEIQAGATRPPVCVVAASACAARQCPRTRRPSSRSSFSVQAGGTTLLGLAPAAAWGPVIGAELASDGGLSYSFGLTVERALTGTIETPPAAASFGLSAGRGYGCLRRFGGALQECVQIAVGRFEAAGHAVGPITRVEVVQRPWLSIGPSVRTYAEVARGLGLYFQAALPVALLRERLVFRTPDMPVFKTWPITAMFSVGLETRLFGSTRPLEGIAQQ